MNILSYLNFPVFPWIPTNTHLLTKHKADRENIILNGKMIHFQNSNIIKYEYGNNKCVLKSGDRNNTIHSSVTSASSQIFG